jgi:hypothetical protein
MFSQSLESRDPEELLARASVPFRSYVSCERMCKKREVKQFPAIVDAGIVVGDARKNTLKAERQK